MYEEQQAKAVIYVPTHFILNLLFNLSLITQLINTKFHLVAILINFIISNCTNLFPGAMPGIKNPILVAKMLVQEQQKGLLPLGRVPPGTTRLYFGYLFGPTYSSLPLMSLFLAYVLVTLHGNTKAKV